MKLLYWNCCGFGKAAARHYLRLVLRQHQLELFCLAETEVLNTRRKLQQLGYDNVLEIPPKGRKWDIAVAWKLEVIFYVHFVVTICKSCDFLGALGMRKLIFGMLWNRVVIHLWDHGYVLAILMLF